jgi:hypothetical protein
LGAISYAGQGDLLVEIASDAKKDYLMSVLKGIETRLPLMLWQVGWGWLVTPAPFPPDKYKIGYFGKDPFAGSQPQLEATKFYVVKNRSLIKIIASFGVLVLTILLYTLSIFVYFKLPALFERYSFLFNAIWLFGFSLEILNGSPVIPWMFPRRIQCDPSGIDIQYWLSSTSRRLEWREILSLTLSSNARYTLHSAKNKYTLRFIDNHSLGSGGEAMLIKTIIERASLHLVEANVSNLAYKRFDAP